MSTIGILTGTLNSVPNAILQVNFNPDTNFFTNNPDFISVENPELENLLTYSYNDVFTFEQDLADYYIGQGESDEVYRNKINQLFGTVSTGSATEEEETEFNNAITSLSATYPPDFVSGTQSILQTNEVILGSGSAVVSGDYDVYTVQGMSESIFIIIYFNNAVGYQYSKAVDKTTEVTTLLYNDGGTGRGAVYEVDFENEEVRIDTSKSDTSTGVFIDKVTYFTTPNGSVGEFTQVPNITVLTLDDDLSINYSGSSFGSYTRRYQSQYLRDENNDWDYLDIYVESEVSATFYYKMPRIYKVMVDKHFETKTNMMFFVPCPSGIGTDSTNTGKLYVYIYALSFASDYVLQIGSDQDYYYSPMKIKAVVAVKEFNPVAPIVGQTKTYDLIPSGYISNTSGDTVYYDISDISTLNWDEMEINVSMSNEVVTGFTTSNTITISRNIYDNLSDEEKYLSIVGDISNGCGVGLVKNDTTYTSATYLEQNNATESITVSTNNIRLIKYNYSGV